MIVFTCRVFLVILFAQLSGHAIAQDDWDVAWQVVGDSAELIPKQNLILTGRVTQKDSGEPVTGASISAETFKYFDYTDQTGSYVLELPPGRYRIMVRHVGMKTVYLRLRIVSSGLFNIQMEEGTTGLDEVVISSRAIDSNVKQSLPGLTKLNVQEIKTLPTLMGEVDILKSLQLLPGVSSVGEGSAGFNVRGGRMDQNLVLLNDVPLFNTSHALGFVSAFNQDIVKDFSLFKGNVPANLGGRASSVLEITTRRGDFDKWKFQGGVGPITSRISAEGPIKSGKSSILLAGRISHANWLLKKVADPNVKRSKLSFYDTYAGWSHRFSSNSTTDVTFYSSADEFQYSDQFGYAWNNHVVNGKWQALTDRNASPILSISYGHFKNTLIDPSGVEASEVTNTLNYFQISETVNYIRKKHNIIAGVSGIGYLPKAEERQGYKGNPRIERKSIAKNNGVELAIFANDDYEISENFSISLGLRYSHYTHLGEDTLYTYQPNVPKTVSTIEDTIYFSKFERIKTFGGLEPRISARFNITPSQSVKASYNRMRQYIHLISNTTSPTPIDLWQVSNEYLPPQVTDNYSIGYFLNIKDNRWETSAELFYKDMRNLVEYKDFPALFLNPHLETELLTGSGRAYGGELYIRRLKGKWTGWISYTYSQTELRVPSQNGAESINDGKRYSSNYNKPHTFNLVIDRKLRNKGAFSVIVSYTTGRPLTAIESSYIVGSTVVPIYSDRNEYKIPNYLRIDFSFTIGNIVKKIDDSLVFSVYNLLGRDNAYSVFYRRPANNYFIPKPFKLSVLGAALPSITYNFKF
ncbi:TonB-dependent receptor [Chryseolinea sp. H1M3-3]|uniref:TonB-dependent receptor n=1 Tax=Chryseolinea sp. H1M3-3 TaxID=3034144 RepID=UPI0023ED7732|nr:TonB-dependent receptor [Chryseolinea sp. H1M3-3]